MGIDVNIYLNPHAKIEQIFEVMLKAFGGEMVQKQFTGEKEPNFDNPPNINNRWYLTPVKNNDNKIELVDPTYFRFHFKSCSNEIFSSLVHLDCEEGHIPTSKALMPQSTATWCAIGKKLVDFFGGKLQYRDDTNEDNPENFYLVNKPKFPARKVGEDSNTRFYKYYNLLHNETVLTTEEINNMAKHCSHFSDTDKRMILFLEKYWAAQELTQELKNQPYEKITRKTLKV